MKKIWLATALALTFIFSACDQSPQPTDIAEVYQNARELSVQVNIVATSDVIVEYELSHKLSNGVAEVTILRPEELEGITAKLAPGSADVSYDGVSAEMLLPGIPGFTPADAMHMLLDDLANSAPSDLIREQNGLVALTYSGNHGDYALEKRVWLDAESLAVSACELFVDGRMLIRMDVTAINIF